MNVDAEYTSGGVLPRLRSGAVPAATTITRTTTPKMTMRNEYVNMR